MELFETFLTFFAGWMGIMINMLLTGVGLLKRNAWMVGGGALVGLFMLFRHVKDLPHLSFALAMSACQLLSAYFLSGGRRGLALALQIPFAIMILAIASRVFQY